MKTIQDDLFTVTVTMPIKISENERKRRAAVARATSRRRCAARMRAVAAQTTMFNIGYSPRSKDEEHFLAVARKRLAAAVA